MTAHDLKHLRLSMVDDVALVEVTSADLQGPELARELEAELSLIIAQGWARRTVVDFHRARFLSSTGFAVLFDLARRAREAGVDLRFCNMNPDLRLGADIVGVGHVVPIDPDRETALRALAHA